MTTHCFYTEVARRKLSAPPEWLWCRLEAIGHDTLVEGGIPRPVTRGKNKGSKSWRGVERSRCVVTKAELDAEHADYEQTTGRCWMCLGESKTIRSASARGNTYSECSRCKGTGAKQ